MLLPHYRLLQQYYYQTVHSFSLSPAGHFPCISHPYHNKCSYSIQIMSQNELIRNSLREEEDNDNASIIAICQPDPIDDVKVEERLKKIFAPIEYPTCGSYTAPDLRPIKERKLELGKKFLEEMEKADSSKNSPFDGIYEELSGTQHSGDNLCRQKIRMVGDLREEYFQENGEYLVEKELFSQELSKLANISFDSNHCLQTFQKNAIISERNNQKKQTPFQLELFVAALHLTAHPLHSQEEAKFQQIRPLLKQWAAVSTHPILPQIAKQLHFLEGLREQGQQLEEVQKKIQVVNKQYNQEKGRLEHLINQIVKENEELKDIRKRTGMETVPWKIHLKEYTLDGRPSYDVGVTPFEVNEKVVAANPADIAREEQRRQQIRNEKYYVRIYANNNEVGRSEKVKLQWPSFRVNFQQKFSILLYTAPATLKVEVVKAGFIDTLVDTLYLSVPGLKARSIISSEKRYSATPFSANGPQIRKQIRQQIKGQERAATEAPAGVVLHRMEWKGESSKMPLIATKTAEEETACTIDTESEEASAYGQLFDPLDPRMQHKQMREKVEADIKRTGGDALLPFLDVQSARHLLLKMKNQRPELEKIQVPLNEEEIRNREDLQQIIQDQYNRARDTRDMEKHCFNPLQGLFAKQPPSILQEIKNILRKVSDLRGLASGGSAGNTRYKITEQIISEYIFEQMESPIAIFFRNLFTQKRKLGPSGKTSIQAKSKVDELQINLHLRSARNVPIRESSFERIKKFQDEENQFKQQQMMANYNNNAGLFDRFNGYGQSFFRQQPNINMHGNTFFNAFQNQGRPNQEVSYNDHTDLDRVNAFVELRYKKMVRRTRCFQGPFPEWNETLCFNFSMKHQETNLEKIMMGCENSLRVVVFDMMEESKATQAISEARVKKTKLYLGRIDIPLAFLVAVPSLSGLFKIDRPLVAFGYGIRRSGLFDFQNEPEEQSKTENPDIHTYVNLDLFTEPLIDSLVAYNADRKFVVGAGENPLVLQRANDWLESLNTKRYVRLWLNDLEGKSVFICRFLSENICPPKLSNEGSSMIERAARFVSLIPPRFNCRLLEGTEEFHLKCAQLLSVKMGEDHGILLCNYFNYIDKVEGRRDFESLLVVCKAFPYGKCIFVMRRDRTTKNCEIWDPFKGECYYFPAKEYEVFCCLIRYQKQAEAADKPKDICPIVQLSCIVSSDNIYFNLQEELKPPSLDLNIDDEKIWRPFLTERTRSQLFQKGVIETVQPPIVPEYYPEYHKLQSSLETELNQFIRDSLEKERRNHFKPYTFKLNDRITNIIYNKLMPLCEAFKVDHRLTGNDSKLYSEGGNSRLEESTAKIQEERDKIKTALPHDKTLFGFTLQATFTTKEEILEKVRETQIHLDENEDIEFVLALRCFEYPCMLVSVWVFIGVIA